LIKLKDILNEDMKNIKELFSIDELRGYVGDTEYDVNIKNNLLIISDLNVMINLGSASIIPQGNHKMMIGLNSELFPYLKDYNIYVTDRTTAGQLVDEESRIENQLNNDSNVFVQILLPNNEYLIYKDKQGKYVSRYFQVYSK
jgi:hypothetical protein